MTDLISRWLKMADLISREKLLSKIEPDEYYHSNEVRDMVKDCPPITPESLVRHGRWEVASSHEIRCSRCGEIFDIMKNEVERFCFCPNCGAKTDLEADHE